MPKYWVTVGITRSAYNAIEAASTEEARAKAEPLVEESATGGWEEDSPQVNIEKLPEEDA